MASSESIEQKRGVTGNSVWDMQPDELLRQAYLASYLSRQGRSTFGYWSQSRWWAAKAVLMEVLPAIRSDKDIE